MRFEGFSFGSIRIDGVTYDHDVVIDRGEVQKRKKKPSKKFRDEFGHTPLSVEEKIPWKCRCLVVGTGTGALPVMEEVIAGPFAGCYSRIQHDLALAAMAERQRWAWMAGPRASSSASSCRSRSAPSGSVSGVNIRRIVC